MVRSPLVLIVLLVMSLLGNRILLLQAPPDPAPRSLRSTPPSPTPPAAAPPPEPSPSQRPPPPPPSAEDPRLADLQAKVQDLETRLTWTTQELLDVQERCRIAEHPPNREAHAKLDQIMTAKFTERLMSDVLEDLHRDHGLDFIVDSSIQPHFDKTPFTMVANSIPVRTLLVFLLKRGGEFGFEVLNGKVWIRPAEKK